MIVHCISFGTLWWLRPGTDNESSLKFSCQAAVFNTTGFISGSRERRNWIVPGVIRFNLGTCMEQQVNPELTAANTILFERPRAEGYPKPASSQQEG